MVPDAEMALPHDQGLVPVVPSAASSRGAPIARDSGGEGGDNSISSSEEFDSESTSGDEGGVMDDGVEEAHDGEQQVARPPPRPARQQRPSPPVLVPSNDEPWRVVPVPRVKVQAPVGDDSGELVALAKMHVVLMQAEQPQYKSAWLGKPLSFKSKTIGVKIGKI
ncbi:hypothetical protein AMAG_07070 [Allomyces macrogynus ATCC 38327]|uniref:Uncharacterized protein n=1 Tax=Allomyces macrogynus (strain ATCC 38327) TaxID=578462 RepID=A0A0L0SFP0_ALLM3|nr:hypothetical protein AMAG_07070 [Allomyces macrogynus ATCC 38327]|eukprot:KNE61333.1 hypothetical protein AMAG_07070 [Allomyces macrogynus ATCC 38327]